MLNIGIIGVGHWGKNLARNFNGIAGCTLTKICDLSESVRQTMAKLYPQAHVTDSYTDLLNDAALDAIVIAVEAPHHYELGKQAIEAGKHTYIEKPLTLSSQDAAALVRLAEKHGVKLMVGHLLLYHPCVNYLKKAIDEGDVGTPLYLYFQRLNLGIVRSNENAWWSLAPHDISVACYLFGQQPVSVSASGQAYLQEGIEDVVFATLKFADGRMAHIHVSWLDPHKIRKVTLVGSKKMVTFDDMEASEKIRVYDKAAEVNGTADFASAIAIRTGDIQIPHVPSGEPLRVECQHFVDAIVNNQAPRSDGHDGLRVVRVLEAGSRSLAANGALVELES